MAWTQTDLTQRDLTRNVHRPRPASVHALPQSTTPKSSLTRAFFKSSVALVALWTLAALLWAAEPTIFLEAGRFISHGFGLH